MATININQLIQESLQDYTDSGKSKSEVGLDDLQEKLKGVVLGEASIPKYLTKGTDYKEKNIGKIAGSDMGKALASQKSPASIAGSDMSKALASQKSPASSGSIAGSDMGKALASQKSPASIAGSDMSKALNINKEQKAGAIKTAYHAVKDAVADSTTGQKIIGGATIGTGLIGAGLAAKRMLKKKK